MSDKLSNDELHGIIKKAMALRVKYRVENRKKTLPLALLGVHPKNRSGVYPNADRVESLGISLLRDGFNVDEANHEGVCVQEVPMSERPAVAGRYNYLGWNRGCCTDPRLEVCFKDQDTAYGTLSHSHLLLILLSFVNGAKWNVPAEFAKLLDVNGRWDFAAVAAKDPSLAQLCQDGLRMEVLSWKIWTEEPDACSLISQALNRGQAHALKTTEITALAALSGACAKELESAVADKIVFETVQRKVRHELAEYADEPEFIDLFDFVVNLGILDAPFVPHLLDFAAEFVNGAKRQMRLQAFAMVNKIPNTCPWTKIAVIMRAYRTKPRYTWCQCPEILWTSADVNRLDKLEQVLHYFHHTLLSAVADMGRHDRLTFLSNVASYACEAFVKHHKDKEEKNFLEKLCEAASPYYNMVAARFALRVPREEPPQPGPESKWIRFSSVEETQKQTVNKNTSASAAPMFPTVIKFDPTTGKPINAQDSREMKEKDKSDSYKRCEVPWREWLGGVVAHTLDREASDIAAITMVLRSFHCRGDAAAAPISVSFQPTVGTKTVAVFVTKDIKQGELELFPCAPRASKISKTSSHPDRVAIHVHQKYVNNNDDDAAVAASASKKGEGAAATTTGGGGGGPAALAKEATETKETKETTGGAVSSKDGVASTQKETKETTGGALSSKDGVASTPSLRRLPQLQQGDVAAVAATNTYYLHPEYTLPRDVTDAAIRATVPEAWLWQWTGDESLYPFWAVDRVSRVNNGGGNGELREINVERKEKEAHCVTVGAVQGVSHAITVTVRLPVLTNSRDLKAGTRLIMEATPKADVKRKSESWKTQAATKAKAQKLDPRNARPLQKQDSKTTTKGKAPCVTI